jgi:hypothetical protein
VNAKIPDFIDAEIASVNSIEKPVARFFLFRCYKDAEYINLVVVQSHTRETPVCTLWRDK